MLISNPDLINSCRVCRSPNQDGDYECLYQNLSKDEERPRLSDAGILYENLLDISLNVWDYYPQFLCNSCDLQMKLFKKLKDKAYKTLKYLQNLYEEETTKAGEDRGQESSKICEDNEEECLESLEQYGSLENDCENTANKNQENADKEYFEENAIIEYHDNDNETCEYQENANIEFLTSASDEYLEQKISTLNSHTEDHEFLNTKENILTSEKSIATQEAAIDVVSLTNQYEVKIEPKISELKYHFSTEDVIENTINSNETIPHIRLDLEPVMDKNDYVTEIYELLDDESKSDTCTENNENFVDYDVYLEEKTESSSAFSDIEYVIEEESCFKEYINSNREIHNLNRTKRRRLNNVRKSKNVKGTNKKREYKCESCQQEFKNLQQHELHRTKVHNDKYPCNVCSTELKSLSGLHQHLKIHNKPAYQCEVCQKTFNQKAHYQYHMNHHNNVRNFKCLECEKSFITKTDLKVHTRFHTGQRPYVCNICGKDYLMKEHLNTHLLSHTDQYFECDICKNKFATHKTLRMHVKTIHEDEPRFKCSFCAKPFRRKHHLEYHLRLHQKNVQFLDSRYEMVDDPDIIACTEYNTDDLVEQELIDDPGFIALNNDIE